MRRKSAPIATRCCGDRRTLGEVIDEERPLWGTWGRPSRSSRRLRAAARARWWCAGARELRGRFVPELERAAALLIAMAIARDCSAEHPRANPDPPVPGPEQPQRPRPRRARRVPVSRRALRPEHRALTSPEPPSRAHRPRSVTRCAPRSGQAGVGVARCPVSACSASRRPRRSRGWRGEPGRLWTRAAHVPAQSRLGGAGAAWALGVQRLRASLALGTLRSAVDGLLLAPCTPRVGDLVFGTWHRRVSVASRAALRVVAPRAGLAYAL